MKKTNFASKTNPNRINGEIRCFKVKLVGDNIKEPGVYFTQRAIEMADELGLDLVEVAPGQDPPICKIMDYKKYLYDKQKSEKKPKRVETKEIRFRPTTDDNDFNFKARHAEKFLKDGNRVKACVFFKGREMHYKGQGEDILNRLAKAVESVGVVDMPPKMEGYKMNMFLRPKK